MKTLYANLLFGTIFGGVIWISSDKLDELTICGLAISLILLLTASCLTAFMLTYGIDEFVEYIAERRLIKRFKHNNEWSIKEKIRFVKFSIKHINDNRNNGLCNAFNAYTDDYGVMSKNYPEIHNEIKKRCKITGGAWAWAFGDYKARIDFLNETLKLLKTCQKQGRK